MLINEETLADVLLTAEQHLHQAEYQNAYKIYVDLLKTYQAPEIFNNTAICAYQLGLESDCLHFIKQAILLAPNNPWYITQHAQFVANTDFTHAQKLFNKALNLASSAVEKKSEQNLNFDQDLQSLNQIKHCYANLLFNYGCICAKNPDPDQQSIAIDLLIRSLEHNPNLYKAGYNIACCYINIDDLNNAVVYLKKTIDVNPHYSQAHFALSQYYQQMNNTDLAEHHLKQSTVSNSINQANAEYNYGVLEQKRNNYVDALEHYNKCLQINSEHFAACYNSASIYHRLKDISQAIKFYRQALTIKPHDSACEYLLASLTSNSITEPKRIIQAPRNYIENLFDSYADHFDHELLNNLGYQTPEILYNLLIKHNDPTELVDLNILDLGCGTGLSGKMFKNLANTLTGVDISSNMLSQAAKKNIYDHLVKSDLDLFLTQDFTNSSIKFPKHAPYNLVILADVLVYYGDLDKLFNNIKNNLDSAAWVLFSIELLPEKYTQGANNNYLLQANSRFAHKVTYIGKKLTDVGLKLISYEKALLRKQNEQHVEGAVFLAALV